MASARHTVGTAVQALQKKYEDARAKVADLRGRLADPRSGELASALNDAQSAQNVADGTRAEMNASYVQWHKPKNPPSQIPEGVLRRRVEDAVGRAFVMRTASTEAKDHRRTASDLIGDLDIAYPRAHNKRAARVLARLERSSTEKQL